MTGIPHIEKHLSTLALGTHFYRLESSATWFGILDHYLEQGGTVIDSARGYGESEGVIGRWLAARGVRERVVLVTKGGHGRGHGVTEGDFAAAIEGELTTSLELLGTEQVDLYLLHRDSPAVGVGTIMDALNAELQRGRVGALGASNWEYGRIEQANAYARERGLRGFSVISNNLALAMPTQPFHPGMVAVGPAGWEWHRRTGVPLLVYSAQARGFFSGRYGPHLRDAAAGTLDNYDARMMEVYGTDANFARLRRAQQLGKEKGGCSATQIALAWLLHQPLPPLPIVGPRLRDELISCLQAVALHLSAKETHWLESGAAPGYGSGAATSPSGGTAP